jgi:hypothetical protein
LHRLGTQDFEWWRLESAIPAPVNWLLPGLVTWLSMGVTLGTIHGTVWAWLYGALGAVGLTAGLAVVTASGQRVTLIGSAWWRLMLRRQALRAAVLASVTAGLVAGFAINENSYSLLGSLNGHTFALGSFLLIGFATGTVLATTGIGAEQAPTTTSLRIRRRRRIPAKGLRYGVWRRIWSSFSIVFYMMFAWALGFGVIQAARIVVTPAFPPGESGVVHLSNGDSYADYPDGLRFVESAKPGRYIYTTRKITFYTPYYGTQAGPWEARDVIGFFYGSRAECLADHWNTICRAHPPELLRFSVDDIGLSHATALGGKDNRSQFDIVATINLGLNAKISNWLTAPHLSQVPDDTVFIGVIALVILLSVVLVSGLLLWLSSPSDITQAISPAPTLRTDRNAAISRGLALSLLTLVAFIGIDLVTGRIAGVWYTLRNYNLYHIVYGSRTWRVEISQVWGLAVGLIWSIALGLLTITLSQWLRFQVARDWLAVRGRAPWRLMGFLEEAHARGVLRQAGAAYQFRHVRLQERLVNTGTETGQG